MFYQITATITQLDLDGWKTVTQVPVFHLNEHLHGLRNEKQAAEFAQKMILDLLNHPVGVTVATFAMEAL